jgi:iron-sulfur cluster assembly protein
MFTAEQTELETVEPIVQLTPGAVKQVKRQQEKTGKTGHYLRLGVRGGGCSGLSYVIDMDNDPDPEFDQTYEVDGVRVVVDRKSALFLKDTVLDYNIKNLMEGGFVFQNPNAMRSCGCGTSFTAK